ncbi:hypothetical protein LCGC14_0264880 [marine sediment metagenome]|uniref:Uncharacterized protein n=1 Tax=marine sediment metagenome TaxID=412755 RepID=A0A0F9U121_9ZZZZ
MNENKDELTEAEDVLADLEGVRVVVEKPITEIVGEFMSDLEEFKSLRKTWEEKRISLLAMQRELADRGLNIEVDALLHAGETAAATPGMTVVNPVIPESSGNLRPEPEDDEEVPVTNVTSEEKDSRTSAQVVTQAHEGIKEDPQALANALASGYGSAVTRGFEEAGRRAERNVKMPTGFN